MSERCEAWRLPLMQRLLNRYGLKVAVTKGCQVNLRDRPQGQFLQKGWKIATTHEQLAEHMNLPCKCPRNYQHARCEGRLTPKSALYTPEYVKRVAKLICRDGTYGTLMNEVQGRSSLLNFFGLGDVCTCHETNIPARQQICGSCVHQSCQGQGLGYVPGNPSPQASPQQVSQEGTITGESTPEPSSVTRAECPSGGSGLVQGDPSPQAVPQQVSQEGSQNGVCTPEGWVCQTEGENITPKDLENMAQALLKQHRFSYADCEALLTPLTSQTQKNLRRMLPPKDKSKDDKYYGVIGMYSYGNQYGETNLTKQYPTVTQYLNCFMKHHTGASAKWTSLVVSKNTRVPIHRDNHNDGQYPNWIIGMGPYQHGELWVEAPPNSTGQDLVPQEQPNGERLDGRVHPTRHQVVQFSPKAWHGTCPWQGTRFTVTAYVSRGWNQLSGETRESLKKKGFQVPNVPLECHAVEVNPELSQVPEPFNRLTEAKLKRQLYLLHAATGHGSTKHLVEALKRRGASERVLRLAREFRCSVCEEKQRVGTRPLATLEPLPPKLSTVSADVGHWRHPSSG